MMQEDEDDDEMETLVSMNGVHKGTTTTKLELTVDEVIEGYVGTFGFAQLIHVFLVSLAWIFDSQNTLVTIFTDAQPSWKCKPQIGTTNYINWCNNTIDHDPHHHESICGLVSGSWEWIGGKQTSIISEWGLVCDYKFRAGIPASLFFLGSLFGTYPLSLSLYIYEVI